MPRETRKSMRVPARIYASAELLSDALKDKSLDQLVNIAALPGIVNYSLAMPDIHEGYGFPIGGIGAMDIKEGVISPGGVGYDINCGLRLLKSNFTEKEIEPYLDNLATEIQKRVPSGLGQRAHTKIDVNSVDEILKGGAWRLVEQGYGEKEDLLNCESEGKLSQADPFAVSNHAKNRGRDQLGTLGSGNHFLEIQKVAEIFDEKIAKIFGLFENQVVVMIHTGSRGLGHQIATDYIKIVMAARQKYKISLPDRELAACPLSSTEGERYLAAMSCGANYAWANRQLITYSVRLAWQNILGSKTAALVSLYDVAHNIAKIEKHLVGGQTKELILHRKGATRAFPPGHSEIPETYRESGQPVILPGSMGTASYLLAGQPEGKESFYSTAHGAGRKMSRHKASRQITGQEVAKSLKSKGIIIKCKSLRGLAEESPLAYKDIKEVVEIIQGAGLSQKVAKLLPLAVIKGE